MFYLDLFYSKCRRPSSHREALFHDLPGPVVHQLVCHQFILDSNGKNVVLHPANVCFTVVHRRVLAHLPGCLSPVP
ncbi:unnamed protein product, partial [Prunus brigantina]